MIQASTDATRQTTSANSSSSSKRSTYIYAAAAVLSLIGLADATYLTIEHITGQSVRCTIVSGCSEVLSSRYATVGGMPLALVGALRISLCSLWPRSRRSVTGLPERS